MPKPSGGSGGGKGKTTAQPPAGAIVGTEQGDTITTTSVPLASTSGDDVIWTLGGDDVIEAGDGNDVIEAGDGNDTIYGGAGDDIINGGAGSDVIYGSTGSDTIDGGTGDGIDVVYYIGVEGVDYDLVPITAVQGKGKNAQEVVVGFEVYHLDGSGDVDTITNVDQVLIVETPPLGAIVTQGEVATVAFDGTETVDVLANDYIEGQSPGTGLSVSAIVDVQIDLDGDGINDLDLIPDSAETDLSYFVGGGLLNDGSILTLNPDDTLTWDPNGQYDTAPALGDSAPVIQFWYEASDGLGGTSFGDVTFQVTYPPQPGDIMFEDMVSVYDEFTADLLGLWIYQDGPDGSYLVSQLSSGTGTFEKRDGGATDFDYDLDGDDEFRIWTEADGTTHEMNITHRDGFAFDVGGRTFIGLDAGETATIVYSDSSGNTLGQSVVTEADLDPNGVVSIDGATGIGQVNVIASSGGEFYVDDFFFL